MQQQKENEIAFFKDGVRGFGGPINGQHCTQGESSLELCSSAALVYVVWYDVCVCVCCCVAASPHPHSLPEQPRGLRGASDPQHHQGAQLPHPDVPPPGDAHSALSASHQVHRHGNQLGSVVDPTGDGRAFSSDQKADTPSSLEGFLLSKRFMSFYYEGFKSKLLIFK